MAIKDDSFCSFSFGYRMRKDVLLSSGAREIEKKFEFLTRNQTSLGPNVVHRSQLFREVSHEKDTMVLSVLHTAGISFVKSNVCGNRFYKMIDFPSLLLISEFTICICFYSV